MILYAEAMHLIEWLKVHPLKDPVDNLSVRLTKMLRATTHEVLVLINQATWMEEINA